jgi:Calcium-binding EGF domain
MHRQLFFLEITYYCRPINGAVGDSYQTVVVLRILSFFTRIFHPNDILGSCGEVCTDICNHKPCYSDYISPDDSLCECFTDGTYQCAANSFCSETEGFCFCNAGYEGDTLTGCVDIDECRTDICDPGFMCINTPGSYSCIL